MPWSHGEKGVQELPGEGHDNVLTEPVNLCRAIADVSEVLLQHRRFALAQLDNAVNQEHAEYGQDDNDREK